MREQQEKQAKWKAELWNNLGDDTDKLVTAGPKVSFEAVLKETMTEKPVSFKQRKSTSDFTKAGKDFKTKNAWGMNPSLL